MKKIALSIYVFSIFLFTGVNSFGQELNWKKISKNDIYESGIFFTIGHAQGWREETLYHNSQLRQNFPGLFTSGWGHFWDGRAWVENETKQRFDANHVLKGIMIQLAIVGVIIKVGDLKNYKGWNKIGKIGKDILLYYGSYQAGFASSYYLINHNKL